MSVRCIGDLRLSISGHCSLTGTILSRSGSALNISTPMLRTSSKSVWISANVISDFEFNGRFSPVLLR